MKESKYMLIDNVKYLEYFMRELKDRYIPITTDIYLKSFFESKGIKTIWILDYLSKSEIERIKLDTSSITNLFIDKLDESNSSLYEKVFGERRIRFFYGSMKYLFKRCLISGSQFLKGLESIVESNNITELSYLHDDSKNFLCGNLEQKSFLFPDDITWKLIQCWHRNKKPKMVFLKVSAKHPLLVEARRPNSLEIIKNYLRPIKRSLEKLIRCPYRYLYRYSPSKRTLLLLSPLYGLSFILFSLRMSKKYNIVNWDIDHSISPEFLRGQPPHSFFASSKGKQISDINYKEIIDKFNLNIRGLEEFTLIKDFDFSSFVTPLIKDFVEKKLLDIIRYWKAIESIHRMTKIDVLFWGNSPHRYPAGIATEFCRLNKIPIVGMQHGGGYGSNFGGRTHFDLDFEKCDFWFSYGFNTDDLKKVYPNENSYPEILPVGSTAIFKLATALKSIYRRKIKVKVLYPMQFFMHFFWKAEIQIPENELFCFQKQIIDLLLPHTNKYRVILKFIPGGIHAKQPLRPYLDSLASHNFEIIGSISYRKVLEKYKPKFIILDTCSTPLNESLVTGSNIIVYNDQDKFPLTEDAAHLLSKRAFVCNSKEEFLDQLEKCLNNRMIEKDLENKEFLEKYCIYKGNPKTNITNVIAGVIDKKGY